MSKLEDILPEMAGVFAAQESALANAVDVVTTQLQNLGRDHLASVQRVRQLEATQHKLLETLTSLQATNEALQEQQQLQMQELEVLRHAEPDFSELQATLQATLQAAIMTQLEAHAKTFVTTQLEAIEKKLVNDLDGRLQHTSLQAHVRAQQSEDAMRTELEILEKRFEYLSRVKMEVKDLGKRIEKQDQTLDDMRTGFALLAKSVGTDEIDDSDHEDDKDRLSQSESAPIVASFTAIAPPDTENTADGEEEPTAEENTQPEATVEELDKQTDEEEPKDDPTPLEVDNLEGAEESPEQADEATQEEDADEPVTIESPTEQVAEPPSPDPAPTANEEAPVLSFSEPPEPEEEVVAEPESPEITNEEAIDVILQEVSPDNEPESVPEVETAEPPAETTAAQQNSDASDGEESDDDEKNGFSQSMRFAPVPAHPRILQHMSTSPNLSSIAYARSKREQRSARRKSTRRLQQEAAAEQRESNRTPLTHEQIRELWLRMLHKFIQLRRLHTIQGTSPDRTIFRKQQISMGARVRRLEETSTDLEDTMEMLEVGLNSAAQNIQMLDQALTQSTSTLEKRTKKLEDLHQMHRQTMVSVEEKISTFESELRRVRHISRRESVQGSISTAMFSQMGSQLHDILTRLTEQTNATQALEKALQRLEQVDVPALATRLDHSLEEVLGRVEFKMKELMKELSRTLERSKSDQQAAEARVEGRLTQSTDQIHHDLLVLTSSLLFSIELLKPSTASSAVKTKPQKNPVDVGASLLQTIIASFERTWRRIAVADRDEADDHVNTVHILQEKLNNFRNELTKLQEQASKVAGMKSETSSASESLVRKSSSSSLLFDEHLATLVTMQLRAFESVLVEQSRDTSEPTSAQLLSQLKDLVVQLRAVLFFLLFHRHLMESRQDISDLQQARDTMRQTLTTHDFALNQFGVIEAVVKMMNSRMDSFVDLTFSFAKDADVKKSMQEILHTNEELREVLTKKVETTDSDAVQRDGLLEREVTQLVARVNKKLDKDEMLWTQEVLERQVQNVAKSALGEEDLVQINRALRSKLDKGQFQVLLQQQHAKMMELGGGNNALMHAFLGDGGGDGRQPLVGTKCISCNGELPPSKPQIQAVVKEEVQQEVAKALARQTATAASMLTPASPSFNISSHRSLDKHKKDLLLASLQQQQQKPVKR
ncbi:hypothetical protein Poli38472_002833 [Pythium oligandrum]|uniref:Uncharacterized protein n=1 Tax=Pythium oligandrum TaxID=41045 RepID=A0A8K1FFK6_PYTOL|nr:hypothetical protein Poli38472_002833 [Pythium oligandrum]|eukprot:TMW56908.1 hypothetical protein Poli38472_002833 [Pythium oligandrum]